MKLNRTVPWKVIHFLPVLPVYGIISIVIFTFTYFHALDSSEQGFPQVVTCLSFYFCAGMTIICHSIAMLTDPGTAKHKFRDLIKDDNIRNLNFIKIESLELKKSYLKELDELENKFMKEKEERPEITDVTKFREANEQDEIYKKHPLICIKCFIKRPERAHHCKTCNKCVLKMDHHCPWIANCVGFYNQKAFFLFLFYATLGDLIAFLCLSFKAYYSVYNLLYNPKVFTYGAKVYKGDGLIWTFFVLFWKPFTVFIGAMLSLAMVLAIGILLITQINIIKKNFTGIEDHKYYKNEDSPWYIKNRFFFCMGIVLGSGSKLNWLWPTFKPNIYNNGYSYSMENINLNEPTYSNNNKKSN